MGFIRNDWDEQGITTKILLVLGLIIAVIVWFAKN